MKIISKLICLALLMFPANVYAQNNVGRYINQKSIGGFIAAGFPYYNLEVNVGYHPILIGGYLHLPLYQARKNFNIAIDVLPQAGIVPFDNSTEYELGLNIAFVFGFALGENNVISVNLSSGPHYITANIERQARGYIFSDNLNFTFRHKFKIIEAGFTAGIRHISNAGLEEPNLGVEDIVMGFTIARPFTSFKKMQ
jgi:lipid A 3-O-deacylase PagL